MLCFCGIGKFGQAGHAFDGFLKADTNSYPQIEGMENVQWSSTAGSGAMCSGEPDDRIAGVRAVFNQYADKF